MKKKLLRRLFSFFMVMIMCVTLIPSEAWAASDEILVGNTQTDKKTISILGHSVCTYDGYSNGAAAYTTNSTIANGYTWYSKTSSDVTVEDTWWYQAAKELDMQILVNNSWSGSCMAYTYANTYPAYYDRCEQLHDNTGANAGQTPDIIVMYISCNDFSFALQAPSHAGTYAGLDYNRVQIIAEYDLIAAQTIMEAYAVALYKINKNYPNAEVYCITSMPRVSGTQPTWFNGEIAKVAKHYGANVVNLDECVLQSKSAAFDEMLVDGELHPNSQGMDAITNAFVAEVLENSSYISSSVKNNLHHVSYNLGRTISTQGTSKVVIDGDSFETTLVKADSRDFSVVVTMGGKDITKSCYDDGQIYISEVTGDIVITDGEPNEETTEAEEETTEAEEETTEAEEETTEAEEETTEPEDTRAAYNYRWEYNYSLNPLTNVTSNGNTQNVLNQLAGSAFDHAGKAAFLNTRYELGNMINLYHDRPWSIEWKSYGTFKYNAQGAQLFSESASTATEGNKYFFRQGSGSNPTIFGFGVYENGSFKNYGVDVSGYDTVSYHTYRLTNKVASDGTNMVYLYIDDVEVGALNQYFEGYTATNKTDNWISGKDFAFSHMGTDSFPIDYCVIDYIQVWENGK